MTDFKGRLLDAAQWAGVGKSQATMAESLSLNRQTINRWLQGGEPNADMLLHIARTWGVDPQWLKSGNGDMLPKPSPEDLPADELDLLKDYRKASPSARQTIRTMVRALRKSVVTIAAVIPPLLAPTPADAAILHNHICNADAAIICIACRRVRRWLRDLVQHLGVSTNLRTES